MTNEARIYECRKSLLTLFHASDFVILSSLDIRHSDSTTFAMHPELRARFNADFTNEAVYAANKIAAQTQTAEFAKHAASAIPAGLEVPNESSHPEFLIVDLGICAEGTRLVPRLIELQAFPSLYGFQL